MVTITGSDTFFTNVDSSYTATKWEAAIDQAINELNTYGKTLDLPNMTGAAGSKTLSVTSAEAGAIQAVAVAIYSQIKQSGSQSSSFGVGGLSMSSSSGQGSGAVENLAKDMAEYLRELDVSIG